MKSLALVLLTLMVAVLLAPSPAVASANTAKLVTAFKAAKTEKDRLQTLSLICKEADTASYVAYYKLLADAPFDQLGSFGVIFGDSKNIDVLIHLGDYAEDVAKPFREEAKRLVASGMTEEEAIAILTPKAQPILDKLSIKLTLLKDSIIKGAKPNQARLVEELKAVYQDDERPDADMEGAIGGLYMLGEEGFETLLQSIKTEDDKNMVFMVVPRFQEFAVMPTLKMIENPTSSALQKDAGTLFIYAFAMTEATVDKLVEAIKHGRYFPAPKNQPQDINSIMNSIGSFWGIFVHAQLEKNPQYTEYIGKKYLFDPNGQSAIISLMMDMDPGRAMKIFQQLDINALSKESRDMLVLCFHVPDYKAKEMAVYENDRYLLLDSVFKKATDTVRAEMGLMYRIDSLSPTHQQAIIVTYFAKITKDEKEIAIYMAAKQEAKLRDEIYAKIRPQCDTDLAEMITYYQEKNTRE